ncbi:glucosidase 2 subunit beta-like [Atheta coriaria]|uniref:glucosidase 2 subunit beta-like n=1 Tax=Dalotia coriaria TaxID=877792 RepID=UPI0031F408D7
MKRPRPTNELILHVIVAVLILNIAKTEVPRPRGVSLSRAGLYDPAKDFTCFDNTLTIPFAQVNDEYCDCADGSDEPGTSACPNSMFHCTNAGHQALNIFSSRVNDGICDCCDGTDEYVSKKCPNTCKERGQHAREAARLRAELVKAGKQLRNELSAEGIKMKQQKKDKLVELQKSKIEAERVMKEKEELKKQAEDLESVALEEYRKIEDEIKAKKAIEEAEMIRKEATETFEKFDSNADGLLSIPELQTRQPFDKDHNGEVSEEEARSFLDNRESINLEDFIVYAWPLMKPIMMREQGVFKPPVGVGEVEEVPLNDAREVNEEPDEEPEPPQYDDEEDDEEDEEPAEEHHEEDETDTNTKVEYDEETQKLVSEATQARSEFTDAEASVRNIQSEITRIEEYLRKDFGADEAFAALEGHCFEYTDHEYIYKLCPFDKAVQQAKSSAMDTRLGTWSKWTGPEGNPYESMLYDHGQACWNGPSRSTRVQVSCSSENKLISVAEPNRCEYLFEFSTPAACYEVEQHPDDVHDEL